MRRNIFTVTLLLIATLVSAQQKGGMVVIKGTLNGDLKDYNKIYMYTRTSNDSSGITGGHYTFSFPFTQVGMKMLYPEYIKEMHMIYEPFGILITGPGTYYVVSDISKGMPASELKGPEPMVLYHRYQEDEKGAYKKINPALAELYGQKWWQADEKDPVYARIQSSRDSLGDVYIFPLIRKLVKEHPSSYASAYVLVGSGREVGTLKEKEDLYNLLSPSMQKSDAGQNFRDYIQGLKSSSVGNQVADFTLPDPAGKNIDFTEFKGKYVLVDFWASWCVPCRQSFPHMRELYKKYKSTQFEIYNISIDEDKEAWLKAVKEEKNPWPQSLDNQNISQKGFAVTGIPASFLIDPEGKIIAREVGFEPGGEGVIEKKIKEIFPAADDGKQKSIPMVEMN